MDLVNKFSKGFNNLFQISPVNIFILASLIIILVLTYMQNNKMEIFDDIEDRQERTMKLINKIDDYNQQIIQFKKTLTEEQQPKIDDKYTQYMAKI